MPDFQGPWAAEFTSTYQAAQSDFVRSVLVDGAISDQEWAETRDRFTQCMSAFGISNVSFEDNGALSFDEPDGVDPDTVSDQTKQCSDDSGEAAVGSLHSWTRRNPEKQDENAIMAACLVRKGAVDPSYTADQYAKDLPDESFPFIAGSSGPAAFRECTLDPLGLFG